MAREYFCAYHSLIDSLMPFTDEEAGRIFKAALIYSATGEIPELTGNERFLFPTIKGVIDRDKAAYDAKCEKNKNSISKRYERIQTNTNVNERIQTNTDVYERYQEKEKEEEKEKDKEKEKTNTRARRAGVFELFAEDDQDLLDALIAFRSMRKQIKKPLTERGEELICKKLADLTQDHTVMISILDQSIERGWQGVFPIKDEPTPAPRPIQQTAQNVRGPLTFSPPGAEELRMLRRLEEKEGSA